VIEAASLYLNEMNNFNQSYKSSIELEKANWVYFNSTKREEHFGTKSVLDLLISKQQLYQSQTGRINYYYDYITAIFKLEALIGNLSASN
jgi:outer membrane protein TolC